jgi:hypothetical protein
MKFNSISYGFEKLDQNENLWVFKLHFEIQTNFAIFFPVAFIVVAMALGVTAEDYCAIQSQSCGGRRHIGCNNAGYWGTYCPPVRELVTLTQTQKNQIVNLHNSLRNKIASGQQSGFKPAARMATMVSFCRIIRYSILSYAQSIQRLGTRNWRDFAH